MLRYIIYILSLVSVPAIGQNYLHIESSDSTIIPSSTIKINSGQFKNELDLIQNKLLNDGFLSSSFDSVFSLNDTLIAKLYIGNRYRIARLSNENIDEEILASSGFRDRLYLNKPLNVSQVKLLFERVLQGYEQNGYPFARLRLELDSVINDEINARLVIEPQQSFEIDSIYIKSEEPLNLRYITNAIRIKQGDIYNQKLLDQLSTRIKEISFVTEIRPAELVFRDGKADLYLYLKKKVANRFNGVIGFLPDNSTGKITITGEVRLDLINAFNAGEELHLSWRKLQTFTQELDVVAHYPFIFGMPIGVGGELNLYKRDSTYLEVSPTVELRYQLEGRNYFSLYFNQYQSTLLNPADYSNVTKLPAFNDTHRTLLGIQASLQDLDYRINPRAGYIINIKAGTGFKRINRLDEIDPALYEGVKLTTRQHQVGGHIGYYLPLFGRTTLYSGLKGAWLINDKILINEMKRLGGISTLRGFDDQSILASAYAIATLEYRFLLEQNSYLYAFIDYGYYENKSSDAFIHDQPMGIGAGISFETRPGIFTINYALGKLRDTNFLLRAGKIHFGFVNYF